MREATAEFQKLGVAVLIIVGEELFRARVWQQKLGLEHPILADPAAHVQGLYGIARQLFLHEEWVNVPASFVLDRRGLIRDVTVGRSYQERVPIGRLLAQARAAT